MEVVAKTRNFHGLAAQICHGVRPHQQADRLRMKTQQGFSQGHIGIQIFRSFRSHSGMPAT